MGDVYILNGKVLSGLPNHAKDIVFNNTGTDLISTNSEDAIKEVDSNKAGFIDASNLVHQITTYNSSWTATQDCFVIAAFATINSSGNNAQIFLDNVRIGTTADTSLTYISFPMKTGQVISTRNDANGSYDIRAYATL